MIISVVGSGGKTTLIKKLAARYRREGKTVLVTTTTHMFLEEDTLLTDDAKLIIHTLKETGYAMAGVSDGAKINALSKEAFLWLLVGGIIYTIGGIIYACKFPVFNRLHKNFGSHEIFHCFVLAGSMCHFVTMYCI